jgi:hypothetical protein
MNFPFGPHAKRRSHRSPTIAVRTGDTLVDANGERFSIGYRDDEHGYLILRPEGAPRNAADVRSLTYREFDNTWTHIPRKEVSRMARTNAQPGQARGGLPTLPKMTRAEWLKRDKTTVTLTREELEQLAQLVSAGHALIRDGKSISPKLKAAMTRLGIKAQGL